MSTQNGVTARLFLVLMDGQPHHSREFLDFLAAAVNPVTALRTYTRNRNRGTTNGPFDPATVPTDHMTAVGTRRVVFHAIDKLVQKGFVQLTRHQDVVRGIISPANDDYTVTLTDKGKAYLFQNPNPRSTAFGNLINEMRRLLAADKITLSVRLNDTTDTTTEETTREATMP